MNAVEYVLHVAIQADKFQSHRSDVDLMAAIDVSDDCQ